MKFYDYTVDEYLRAFEDAGSGSDRMKVGGPELRAVFPRGLRLEENFVHYSPRAEGRCSYRPNAAYADKRLDGRRSKKVENCRG